MKRKLLNLLKHPLITGSIIIFTGSFIANILNFLFNLYIATELSIIDYGIFASLVSLITLPGYAANAIVPAVVQFGAKFFSENDIDSVNLLYRKASKLILTFGVIVSIGILLNMNKIGYFFKIYDGNLLIYTAIIIFFSFILFLHLAFLQSKLSFGYISLINITGAAMKLIIGFIFVYIGFKTIGAVYALLISVLVSLLLSLFPLRFIFKQLNTKRHINSLDLISYGVPSAIGLLSLTSLITSDILLVKHFFSSEIAGMYAGLSLIGRVIFYFTAPIATVMFPVIVKKNSNNQSYRGTFLLAILLVLSASLLITLFYYLFPDFVILTFIRKTEYLKLSPVLGLFAFNISLYSVITVFVNFYFSVKKVKIFIPLFLAAMAQILLVTLNHSFMINVIYSTLLIQFLLLIILLLYFPYATKKK